MASYLRPRRGKEATAKSQNIVLKRGEVFFETPSGGVGTGIGKIKMGDGSTSYASLPYFLKQLDLNDNNTKCAFTNATAATDKSNNTTYLNNIAPSNNLKTLFQNIKQLLLNYNSQLTSLNNDLANKQPKGNYQPAGSYAAFNHNHDGKYQPAGSYASAGHNHDDRYLPLKCIKIYTQTKSCSLGSGSETSALAKFNWGETNQTRIACNVTFHGSGSSWMCCYGTDYDSSGIYVKARNLGPGTFNGDCRLTVIYI